MGLSPSEQGEADTVANDLSIKYPSLSRTENLSDLRKNTSRLGSFDRAKEIADTYARAKISNKLSGGDEHELEMVIRAAEGAGAANTSGQLGSFINAFSRAKAANPDYTGEDFAKDYRAAGAAKYGWNKDFRENVFPILASHTLGFGVKMATSNSALIGGRQTPQALKRLRKAGLLDADNKLIDEAGYQANYYDWTQKHIRPLLEAKGVKFGEQMSEKDKRTTSAWETKNFSAKNTADAIITALLDAPLVERGRKRKTMDLGGMDTLQKKDSLLAQEAVTKQTKDFTTALISLQPVTDAMNAYATTMSKFTKEFSEDDTAGKTGKVLGTGLLGAGAVTATAMGASKLYQWFTGAGALTGSATALDASAAALTAAAVELSGAAIVQKGGSAAAAAAGGGFGAKIWGAGAAALPFLGAAGAVGLGAGAYYLAESANERQGLTKEAHRARVNRLASKNNWFNWGGDDSLGTPGLTDTMTYGTGVGGDRNISVSGQVTGDGKLVLEINTSSSFIDVVKRAEAVIHLNGSVQSNGPGSLGHSSPDAAAPAPKPSTGGLAAGVDW